MNPGYRKRVVALLFFLLLSRFWFCQTFELTGPEAYAWMKSRYLDWGYWDQGAAVPWLIHLGTWFYGNTELGIRWLAANLYALTGFLIFLLARQWFSGRVAFWAVALFAITPLYAWPMLLMSEATLSVGLMALALLLFRIILHHHEWKWWLLTGLVCLLATWVQGWNALWLLGFLLFRSLDPRCDSPLMSRRLLLLVLMTGAGFLPFLLWRLHHDIGLATNPLDWPIFLPHQHFLPLGQDWGLGVALYSWLGAGLLAALLITAVSFRSFGFLLREHTFFLCLPLPGIVAQLVLGAVGRASLDTWPALLLPWIILIVSMGCRLSDLKWPWRLVTGLVLGWTLCHTLSGLWPNTAQSWWGSYAPNPTNQSSELAKETSRWQRESGASFTIGHTPQDASLLSFYLPLHPFVYVAADETTKSQYDFWPNYYDFNGAHALFVTPRSGPSPQLIREFEEVKLWATFTPRPSLKAASLREVNFFFCQRYGAAP
jgi:hypothetical protein